MHIFGPNERQYGAVQHRTESTLSGLLHDSDVNSVDSIAAMEDALHESDL